MQPQPTQREAAWVHANGGSSSGAGSVWHGSSFTGRSLAVLALVSVLFGRALASAVPGSRAGIEHWISALGLITSLSSQLLVVFGLSAMVTLLFGTLWQKRSAYLHLVVALPAGAALIVFVALSTLHRLEPGELAIMALASIALAALGGASALSSPGSRAAGLVLITSAVASICHLAGRVAMLEAAAGAPVWLAAAARILATLGFTADIASLALAMTWLAVGRVVRVLSLLGLAAAMATAITWGAMVGELEGASFWQLLAMRTLHELTPFPAPWVTLSSRYWVEAFAFLLAAVVSLYPRRALPTQLAVTFALLARGSADIPACAMLLALGGLLAPVGASVPKSEPIEPAESS